MALLARLPWFRHAYMPDWLRATLIGTMTHGQRVEARAALEQILRRVTALHGSPEWKEALDRNGWDDAFLPADDFGAFLDSENERVAGVLRGLGLSK